MILQIKIYWSSSIVDLRQQDIVGSLLTGIGWRWLWCLDGCEGSILRFLINLDAEVGLRLLTSGS